MGKVVGFIITPGEIENRIQALDKAIMALDADVTASQAPRLNQKWRAAWHAFVRRWAVERDTYASWDSRLFATRVMPRLEGYEASWRQWAAQYEQRTGAEPTVPAPRPSEGLLSFGSDLWLLVALGVVVFAMSKGRG